MLYIDNPSLDPYFNLATEEYLLRHYDTEIVMLWRSMPSIVVGKHQNTLAEINLGYVRRHEIPVVRRLSGGGTVFHDPGNLNFTFIRRGEKEKLIDFRYHTQPVIGYLQSLGVDARFEGKNDLRVQGLKISGNAEHVHKEKVMHHGTLLFESDLQALNEAIKVNPVKFQDKAVKSNRSIVANIVDFLPGKPSLDVFAEGLKAHFFRVFPDLEPYQLQADDERMIRQLAHEKYQTWDWNFGYSPRYAFANSTILGDHRVEVELEVRKGLIGEMLIRLDGKTLDALWIRELQGEPHRPEAIDLVLRKSNFFDYSTLADPWGLLSLFF